MGLVKTRRLAAMRKQQHAKFARYVTYCNMCSGAESLGLRECVAGVLDRRDEKMVQLLQTNDRIGTGH